MSSKLHSINFVRRKFDHPKRICKVRQLTWRQSVFGEALFRWRLSSGCLQRCALVEALERKNIIGIAHWVMRKKEYIGASSVLDGYLTLTTLRRADQVLSFSGIEPAKTTAPQPNELKLAEQLVSSIEADFDPSSWHNEYRERLWKLIEAKARGQKIQLPRPPEKRPLLQASQRA